MFGSILADMPHLTSGLLIRIDSIGSFTTVESGFRNRIQWCHCSCHRTCRSFPVQLWPQRVNRRLSLRLPSNRFAHIDIVVHIIANRFAFSVSFQISRMLLLMMMIVLEREREEKTTTSKTFSFSLDTHTRLIVACWNNYLCKRHIRERGGRERRQSTTDNR